MLCKHCGEKLPTAAAFCPACGNACSDFTATPQPKTATDDLTSKTVVELKEIAKVRGINGYSAMKKADLIQAITEAIKPQPTPTNKSSQKTQPSTKNDLPKEKENPPKKKVSWFWIIAAIVALYWVYQNTDFFGSVQNDAPQHQDVPADAPRPQDAPVLTPEQIFNANVDAAFLIRAHGPGFTNWTGSGFFVCETGVAVTNHHVIVRAELAIAVLQDGSEFEITGYYSYDIGNDLAVIQVDGRGVDFQPVAFGNSYALQIWDDLYSISSPRGAKNSFYGGVLAEFVPVLQVADHSGQLAYIVHGALQTTMPLAGGSSGGTVFNDRGEIVGVNIANYSREGTILASFATPGSRVDLRSVESAQLRPLPLREATATAASEMRYYWFPDVPTFGGVVNEARFLIGMPIFETFPLADGYMGHLHSYDYFFAYELVRELSDSSLNAYSEVLLENGFIFQGEVLYFRYGALHSDGKFFKFIDDGLSEGYYVEDLDESFDFGTFRISMAYFYNATEDVSLLLVYVDSSETVNVIFGRGNVYDDYEGVENFVYADDFEDFLGNVDISGSVREDGQNAIAITDEYLDGVISIDEAIERIRLLERDDWYLLGDEGPLYHLIWQVRMLMDISSLLDDPLYEENFELIINSRNTLARVLGVPERQ